MAMRDAAQVVRARHRMSTDSATLELERLREILCDPARLRIIEALGEEEMSVSDLAAAIDRRVPATSQHLRVLRRLGAVVGRRDGTTIRYRRRPITAVRHILHLTQAIAPIKGDSRPSHGPDTGGRL